MLVQNCGTNKVHYGTCGSGRNYENTRRCHLSLIPGPGVIFGLSGLLSVVLFSAPRGFSPRGFSLGTLVFLLFSKSLPHVERALGS